MNVPDTIQQTTHHGAAAFNAVAMERCAQDRKWGTQNHDPCKWVAILAEEVGELAEQSLQFRGYSEESRESLRMEAVQCAAVAIALVEWIERGMPK